MYNNVLVFLNIYWLMATVSLHAAFNNFNEHLVQMTEADPAIIKRGSQPRIMGWGQVSNYIYVPIQMH